MASYPLQPQDMTMTARPESPSAYWARKTREAEQAQPRIDPNKAECELEHVTEAAFARIVGPDKARELVASAPPETEPRLTAYEASMLRRAAAERTR